MYRKIPATMASQHPDNANVPFWHNQAFVETTQENKELVIMFADLGIDEYMWDWEGKLVDESVIEKVLAEKFDYFKVNQLGKDKFLTYRLPNPFVETEFRLGRAFFGILSADSLAYKLGLHTPPIFEAILPMCEQAKSLIDIQEAFREIASLKHWLLNVQRGNLYHLEPIPLFEQVEVISQADRILGEYVKMHEEKFGFVPKYIRVMVARSDPSLNSSNIANILAIKIALSRLQKFSECHGLDLYPIIGCGSLPFRGGLTPYNVEQFVDEYSGVKTVTIQSAFRYDFPLPDVQAAIAKLNQLLPNSQPRVLDTKTEKVLEQLIQIFKHYYQLSIPTVAKLVNSLAMYVPKRRERMLHIGLFGYSRGVGGINLPRAISFTASMYSLGLPPEIIGTGRALKELKALGLLDVLEQNYLYFRQDYARVGGFVNKANLQALIAQDPGWQCLWDDIVELENYFGWSMEPKTPEEQQHLELSSQIYAGLLAGQNVGDLVVKAALLRKSLG